MKRREIYFSLISLLLLCAIAIGACGCNSADDGEITDQVSDKTQTPTGAPSANKTDAPVSTDEAVYTAIADLMNAIAPSEHIQEYSGNAADRMADNAAASNFALELFKASNESGENTLISPLSVLCALAMTANGAKGETLEQMETTLGMNVDDLNLYIYSYMKSLPQNDKTKLSLANSIWFTDDERFTVSEDFLQTNADYYGAGAFKAPFDDSTLSAINDWVKKNTDGVIPKVLENIPDNALMYLVNALAFEAEWESVYDEYSVHEGKFIKEDGSEQDAEFMYSSESKYFEDENATGFIKYYKGRNYAFAALLPNEGVSVEEYINSLDGEALAAMLANANSGMVKTAIPKFKSEYSVEMSDILKSMGMTLAFDGDAADFSGIGSSKAENIFINKVIHKTYIEVGEKGTKAGAATVVEMCGNGAPPEDIKEVYLDRPFVYMLIDCENNLPFFIGTVMDVQQ